MSRGIANLDVVPANRRPGFRTYPDSGCHVTPAPGGNNVGPARCGFRIFAGVRQPALKPAPLLQVVRWGAPLGEMLVGRPQPRVVRSAQFDGRRRSQAHRQRGSCNREKAGRSLSASRPTTVAASRLSRLARRRSLGSRDESPAFVALRARRGRRPEPCDPCAEQASSW